jgi:hypothetical protein
MKKNIFQYPLSFFHIVLLPILPPPLSPSPMMVAENAPSRYPPYINNNGGGRFHLHDDGEGGNGPQQPQLR